MASGHMAPARPKDMKPKETRTSHSASVWWMGPNHQPQTLEYLAFLDLDKKEELYLLSSSHSYLATD